MGRGNFGFGDIQITSHLPDAAALKRAVPMVKVVSKYRPVESSGKTSCPFHKDNNTPNLHVYGDHAHCFVCGWHGDHFQYIMDYNRIRRNKNVSFVDALELVASMARDNVQQYSPEEDEDDVVLVRKERKPTLNDSKPVPKNWIEFWRKELIDRRREWLRVSRLLSDTTIDTHGLGWRPDYSAYSIPFWLGTPGIGEIDIVQFRSTDKSPPMHGRPWRYMGLSGYNHPSIINRHLLNPVWVVVYFGTLDAILAAQDGIPAISTNGSSVFMNPDRPESRWLKHVLSDVRYVYVVPDATPSEFEPAHRLADMVNGRVKYFPHDMCGKDYTDYRSCGNSAQDFVKDILGMPEYTVALSTGDFQRVKIMVGQIANGDSEGAAKAFLSLAQDYNPSYISHSIQMVTIMPPKNFRSAFDRNEWEHMSEEFADANGSVRDSLELIKKWADIAHRRAGGF